uniref:Uncharacterized protein n=1 Tax=Arundo donax TaxID=35708 RepID=A0A0A9A1R7_ARUDO
MQTLMSHVPAQGGRQQEICPGLRVECIPGLKSLFMPQSLHLSIQIE